jgi:hypothetical protein
MENHMPVRRWQRWLWGLGMAVIVSIGPNPASAQVRELLQELVRPPPPPEDEPVQPPEYQERVAPAPDDQFTPPPRPDRGAGGWEGMREEMFQLREGCQQGDRRSCVRLGIIIGENRQRRAQWRREHPELFWYER